MAKSVIKELSIMLLLCLAIILVLGILLYEYVPMSKTLPNQVSYTTPAEVKEELASVGDVDEDQIVMTYEVNSVDLNNYKKIQDYKPGKANPFSSYESQSGGTNEKNETENSNNGSSSNSGSSSSSNNTSDNDSTSGGQYFQDKGTK